MNLRSFRLLLDPTGTEGGDPTPTPTPTPSPTPTPAKAAEPDLSGSIQSLIAKHGSSERAIGFLLGEAKDYRRRIKEAKTSLPAEGAVILAPEDVQAWTEYRALGKAADLKQALTERTQFRDELDQGRKVARYRSAASAHRYNEDVFADLAALKGLDIEVRTEPVSGKPADVAFVKHKAADGKDVETKLPDYLKAHLPGYLPSLSITPTGAPTGTPPRGGPGSPPPPQGGKRPDLITGNPFSS